MPGWGSRRPAASNWEKVRSGILGTGCRQLDVAGDCSLVRHGEGVAVYAPAEPASEDVGTDLMLFVDEMSINRA